MIFENTEIKTVELNPELDGNTIIHLKNEILVVFNGDNVFLTLSEDELTIGISSDEKRKLIETKKRIEQSGMKCIIDSSIEIY